jgi:PTH1 family peptidyl-tRNA hydrolase
MKLIAALGNPGPQYQQTRHNAGFLALDQIVVLNGLESALRKHDFDSIMIIGIIDGMQCILAYPQTFMNESGRAIAAIMRFHKITADDLLLLHDEIDLPIGTIRRARNSGPAGHNGIKSIIAHVGTMDFRRIRIGIESRVENRIPPTDAFVLQKFTDDELKKIPFEKINEQVKEALKN